MNFPECHLQIDREAQADVLPTCKCRRSREDSTVLYGGPSPPLLLRESRFLGAQHPNPFISASAFIQSFFNLFGSFSISLAVSSLLFTLVQ